MNQKMRCKCTHILSIYFQQKKRKKCHIPRYVVHQHNVVYQQNVVYIPVYEIMTEREYDLCQF